MTEPQKKQLEKFKEFAGWMCADTENAFCKAGAKFLVVMGLFNYIETLGAFKIGYFKKDSKGQITPCSNQNCKDGKQRTSTKDRFNAFFSDLGLGYQNLINDHTELYDELRCGFTHEFLPKERVFQVFGKVILVNSVPSSYMINTSTGSAAAYLAPVMPSCGIMLEINAWKIVTSIFLQDFKQATESLIKKIEEEKSKELMANFFETADQINMHNFEI